MKNSYTLFLLAFLGIAFTLPAIKGDPNKITKKNVELRIPDGFPEPVYKFEGNKITPEGFVLGRMLFYDPILSRDNSTSCATCHQHYAAFSHIDHKLSHGIDDRIGTRNVPALQNLIWKDNLMWDGGVNHLEVQPINPITDHNEMDETLENVLLKLQSHPKYKSLFMAAFGDTLVSTERIFKSMAQFTGLMISTNSKYDQFIRGEIEQTESQKRGMDLFSMKCSSCHTPPLFTDNGFENNGLSKDSTLNDKGRGTITGLEQDNYLFKIPSLRNVEVTYPYMHDGRFKKLDDVLNHYAQLSDSEKKSNKSLEKIGEITDRNKQDIIDFLLTLTDKSFLMDRRFYLVK